MTIAAFFPATETAPIEGAVLNVYSRQVKPGDVLLNAAGMPVIRVESVKLRHGARPLVRLQGEWLTPRRPGRPEKWMKAAAFDSVVRLVRPIEG